MKAIIPVANGCEEIEAVTIADVLRRGGIRVEMLSIDEDSGLDIEGSRGVGLVADEMWNADEVNDADILVLPGGMSGMEALRNDSRVLEAIRKFADSDNKYVAAICAAPAVLHAAGVLKGKRATCYPGMQDHIPDAIYMPNDDVVTDGNIITSRGPATAMKFALSIVKILMGNKIAEETAAGLLFRD